MKISIAIKILLIVAFISQCQNVDIRKKMQEDYKQSISFFNDQLVNHFPTNLPDSCSFGATVPKKDNIKMLGFGVDAVLLWKGYPTSKYKNLSSQLKELSKAIYLATDTNLLLVFSYCDVIKIEGRTYINQEPPERQALAKHNPTITRNLPVPLFEIDEYKGNTMCGLTKDFKLYVLDADYGKYIADKYLQECDCLPKKWKHGYSKGIALSDKRQVIIYWVIVW